jgi:hypothetical protein
VRVERLRLRLPGATREEGDGLARAVAAQLASLLSPTADRRIGGLRVRVPIDGGSVAGRTAEKIAAAVARRSGGARNA